MREGVRRGCGHGSAHLATGHRPAVQGSRQHLGMNGYAGEGGVGSGGLVQANAIPARPPAFLCDILFQAPNFTIWKMQAADRVGLALRASACQEGLEEPEELGGQSEETDLEWSGRGWLLSS